MSSTRIREYTALSTDFEYFFRQEYDFSQDKIGVSPTRNRGTFCTTKAPYAADLGTIYKFIGEALETNALFYNSYKNIEQLNTAEQNLYNLCQAIRQKTNITLEKSVEVFEKTIAEHFNFKVRYEKLCEMLSENAKRKIELRANRKENGDMTFILIPRGHFGKLSSQLAFVLTEEVNKAAQSTASETLPLNSTVQPLESPSEIYFDEDVAEPVIALINKHYAI